jgi:hypothetical protein
MVVQTGKFHESLIFDLIECLLGYAMAIEGPDFLSVDTIGVLRRAAEMTEGLPSEAVRDAYSEIFLRDMWATVPPHQRRPGVRRQFTEDRLRWASPEE